MRYWHREMTGTVVKEKALALAFVTNIVGFQLPLVSMNEPNMFSVKFR